LFQESVNYPVLAAIALEQLPEIYTTEAIVILKFPQVLNNFLATEIRADNQAGVEWTQPFQNIILRKVIPIENIELMMVLELGKDAQRTFILSQLTKIAYSGERNYREHSISLRAQQLVYP
jgi:hypothetical protein